MKTRFIDLFENKVKPEKVFNRYNLDKKDRSDLSKIVNDYNNEGGSTEDNLPKVEKSFIFDYTKNYEDYCVELENIQSFNSCIVIADTMSGDYINLENIGRFFGMIGFTVSSLTCDNDNVFNSIIKPYLIEVPVEDFYGLSNNNRVYFRRNDLSKDQQVEYITKIIDEKFPNLKEGEEIIPNGYIIPILVFADDWGFITGIKKVNNEYMICGIRNGQPFDYSFIYEY